MKTRQTLTCLLEAAAKTSLFVGFVVTTGHAMAQDTDLATKTESAIGVSLSKYKYDEPGYMQLNANKVGLHYSGTYAFGSTWPDPSATWFLRTDLHYSAGSADYQSPVSGHLANTPHWYYEASVSVGKDIQMDGYVLAPYVGLGVRHLLSDLGYKRDSHYTTLPLGVTHKIKLADRSQLLTSVEYMHLLRGQQKAQLVLESVSLGQTKGYGLRLSMLKRYPSWSVGPVFTYWNIGQSEVGGVIPVFEPHNKTTELGIVAAYHF